MHKLTYFLLVLVLGTLGLSVVRHRDLANSTTARQKGPDHHKRINERFPTADYDERDLSDPRKMQRESAITTANWFTPLLSHGWLNRNLLLSHILLFRDCR